MIDLLKLSPWDVVYLFGLASVPVLAGLLAAFGLLAILRRPSRRRRESARRKALAAERCVVVCEQLLRKAGEAVRYTEETGGLSTVRLSLPSEGLVGLKEIVEAYRAEPC